MLVHELFAASLLRISLKRVWRTGWALRGGGLPPCYTPINKGFPLIRCRTTVA